MVVCPHCRTIHPDGTPKCTNCGCPIVSQKEYNILIKEYKKKTKKPFRVILKENRIRILSLIGCFLLGVVVVTLMSIWLKMDFSLAFFVPFIFPPLFHLSQPLKMSPRQKTWVFGAYWGLFGAFPAVGTIFLSINNEAQYRELTIIVLLVYLTVLLGSFIVALFRKSNKEPTVSTSLNKPEQPIKTQPKSGLIQVNLTQKESTPNKTSTSQKIVARQSSKVKVSKVPKPKSSQAFSNEDEDEYVYATAANGMTVRIPAKNFDAWQKEQNRLKAGGAPSPEQLKMAERLRSLLEENQFTTDTKAPSLPPAYCSNCRKSFRAHFCPQCGAELKSTLTSSR